MKRIYRYLLAIALALPLMAPSVSQADNNLQLPIKKSVQIPPRIKSQIVRNGPKPAHHSIGSFKNKKNDFSHLNN